MKNLKILFSLVGLFGIFSFFNVNAMEKRTNKNSEEEQTFPKGSDFSSKYNFDLIFSLNKKPDKKQILPKESNNLDNISLIWPSKDNKSINFKLNRQLEIQKYVIYQEGYLHNRILAEQFLKNKDVTLNNIKEYLKQYVSELVLKLKNDNFFDDYDEKKLNKEGLNKLFMNLFEKCDFEIECFYSFVKGLKIYDDVEITFNNIPDRERKILGTVGGKIETIPFMRQIRAFLQVAASKFSDKLKDTNIRFDLGRQHDVNYEEEYLRGRESAAQFLKDKYVSEDNLEEHLKKYVNELLLKLQNNKFFINFKENSNQQIMLNLWAINLFKANDFGIRFNHSVGTKKYESGRRKEALIIDSIDLDFNNLQDERKRKLKSIVDNFEEIFFMRQIRAFLQIAAYKIDNNLEDGMQYDLEQQEDFYDRYDDYYNEDSVIKVDLGRQNNVNYEDDYLNGGELAEQILKDWDVNKDDLKEYLKKYVNELVHKMKNSKFFINLKRNSSQQIMLNSMAIGLFFRTSDFKIKYNYGPGINGAKIVDSIEIRFKKLPDEEKMRLKSIVDNFEEIFFMRQIRAFLQIAAYKMSK